MKYLKYILLMLVFVGVAEGQVLQQHANGFKFKQTTNYPAYTPLIAATDSGMGAAGINVFSIGRIPGYNEYVMWLHGATWAATNGIFFVTNNSNVCSVIGAQGNGDVLALGGTIGGRGVIALRGLATRAGTQFRLSSDAGNSPSATDSTTIFDIGGMRIGFGGINVAGGSVTARDGFSSPTGGVTSKYVKTDSLRTPMIIHDTSNVSGTDSIAWEIADLVIPRTLRYPYQGAAVYAKKFGKITFRFWHSGTTGIHEALWAADSANGVEVIGVDYVSREVMYGAGSQYFGPRSFFSFVSPGTVNAGSAIAGNSNNFFTSTIYAYPGAAAVSGRINITGSGDNSFYETEYTMTFRMPPGNASTWYVKLYDF